MDKQLKRGPRSGGRRLITSGLLATDMVRVAPGVVKRRLVFRFVFFSQWFIHSFYPLLSDLRGGVIHNMVIFERPIGCSFVVCIYTELIRLSRYRCS